MNVAIKQKGKNTHIKHFLVLSLLAFGLTATALGQEALGKSFTNDDSRQTYVPARDNTFEDGEPTKSFCKQEHHWHDSEKPGYDKGGIGSEPNDRFHDRWGPGILPCPTE